MYDPWEYQKGVNMRNRRHIEYGHLDPIIQMIIRYVGGRYDALSPTDVLIGSDKFGIFSVELVGNQYHVYYDGSSMILDGGKSLPAVLRELEEWLSW